MTTTPDPIRSGLRLPDGQRGRDAPQVAKLKPHDARGGDQFGNAVAMSGAVIAVAAPRDAGAVYLFHTNDGGATWAQEARARKMTQH